MKSKERFFGETPNGEKVYEYELSNDTGFLVKVLNYGGIITEIQAPDKNGILENVVLGFEDLAPYLENPAYFGALVGRVAGRISGASFELNGSSYTLKQNNNNNSLHGGEKGFSRVVWKAKTAVNEEWAKLTLSYISVDMEEGFPGKLEIQAEYIVHKDNKLEICYCCTSDKDTIVVPTNHSYFNLSGNVSRSALQQTLSFNASRYISVDPYIIPIDVCSVEATPFDLREGRVIGEAMDFNHEQIKNGKGYDHPFILDGNPAAVLTDPESGRQMIVETTEPCIVFYAGGYIGNTLTFKDGVNSKDYDGICLETQWYTDAMNKPFPKRILKAGEIYRSRTSYSFGIQQ